MANPTPGPDQGPSVGPNPGGEVGTPAQQAPPSAAAVQPSAPAVRASWNGITVNHGGRLLFRDFSYSVPDGGVVGLVGPAGLDLRVALLALVGRYRLDAGSVAIVDAPASVVVASANGPTDADPLLSVAELVGETSRGRSEEAGSDAVAWALAAVGLSDRGRVLYRDLTLAERTAVQLAAAAANGASVVAIDVSPVAGDPAVASIWALITQLAVSGRLLLVASPTPHEAMNLILPIPHSTEVAS